MTPELTVLLVAGAVTATAYMGLYPRMANKTLVSILRLDLAITCALMLAVGAVYYGSGVRFSLVFFDVPWWAFTLICTSVIEAPFFAWFCKRWNVDLNPPPD
ncbi:hypothetical protein OS189_03035 [Sulfitobacter sp. F26169L]|uniref:hypothetical protein n=1 Tax=Sulfitobacter sp. F26169L TaxID=2996015 RepID=UPI002260B956|nr:hypothetical protein [Sulfitobacter sp. F26169L]MCX7565317.1 hypothetical protein [Sulfitobacter sp. F26169L]